MAHNDPFYVQIGPKKQFLRGFTNYGLQHKLLILIESLNIFHGKSTKKSKVGVVFGQDLGQIRPNVVKNKETGIINGLFSNFA